MRSFWVELNGQPLEIWQDVDGKFITPKVVSEDLIQRGTALKPAWEPIVMARKPLIGTVAENVLEHGTGALNIDGCRIGDNAGWSYPNGRGGEGWHGREGLGGNLHEPMAATLGRWPANIIHDGSDEVLAAFPESDGQQGDLTGHSRDRLSQGVYGDMKAARDFPARNDAGSAARFFKSIEGTDDDRMWQEIVAQRLYYSGKADANDRLGTKHPTVKRVGLMQYLVRLVTPPGGLVLDPFAGTGTTGEAAWREGMRAILIEREPEYQADIARRMELAENPTKRAAVARSKNNLQGAEGTPLFGDA